MGFSLSDDRGSVVVDDRHLPLLICTWTGVPNESVLRGYFGQLATTMARAREQGQRVVMVTDARNTGRPPPTVRRVFSELYVRHLERFSDVQLTPNYVAFDSALLRGTITAINWISNNSLDIESTRELRTALEAGLGRLDSYGIARPAGLDPTSYVAPSLERSAWG